MIDTPTLREALALADRGGPDWESLLARMESPKPWKHDEKIDGANVMIGGGIQNYRCIKCGRQSHRWQGAVDDPVIPYCSFPDPVTEPLEVIVARKLLYWSGPTWHALGSWYIKLTNTIETMTECAEPDAQFAWWLMATPAQQLVCLWKAEGLLPEQAGDGKEEQ